MSPVLALWLLCALSFGGVPLAAQGPGASESSNSALPPQVRIGKISFDTKNVFDLEDPEQDRWAFRLANRFHRVSRERALRAQLLVKTGDPLSTAEMRESERLLRALPGIYEAVVEVVAVHDATADIIVRTRDVWTLSGGVSFGRSGGKNNTGFSLEDSNFLGLGKSISFNQSSRVDRKSAELRYFDRNLAGSRTQLDLAYADNDDGQRYEATVERPFYSLGSKWYGLIAGREEQRVDRRYQLGAPIDVFEHRQNGYRVGFGWSSGRPTARVHRFRVGFSVLEDRFALAQLTRPDDPQPSGRLPEDRVLSYPWVQYELATNDFAEETNLDMIDRTEDRQDGLHASVRLGLSSTAWGGDRTRWLFDGTLGRGWRIDQSQRLDLSILGSTRYGDAGLENSRIGLEGRYYRDQGERWLLYTRLRMDRASNLDYDQQLLLGGDSGLRGYPLRYQDGDRRLLFTVEERLFTTWEPFHLFKVGAAAFLDVGRSWTPSRPEQDGLLESQVLANLGIGLRLGNTRARGTVIHLDVAYPFVGDHSRRSLQWLVSSRRSL